jgi:hypothetical protein
MPRFPSIKRRLEMSDSATSHLQSPILCQLLKMTVPHDQNHEDTAVTHIAKRIISYIIINRRKKVAQKGTVENEKNAQFPGLIVAK